jgi:hypothetical protein
MGHWQVLSYPIVLPRLLMYCCAQVLYKPKAKADVTVDIIQLAMNCTKHEPAGAAVFHIPEQIEPDTARKLLLTAAARHHILTLRDMLMLANMQQLINPPTLEGMLLPLLRDKDCVALLCKLPAASQLSSKAVANVLLTALHGPRRDFQNLFTPAAEAVNTLCGLPAAAGISVDQATELLKACVINGAQQAHHKSNYGTIWGYISKLPSADLLGSSIMAELLNTAIKLGSDDYARRLLALPAAASLNSRDLMQLLLQLSLEPASPPSGLFNMLMQHPNAERLSCHEATQLMCACAERSMAFALQQVCVKPAAKLLSKDQLLQPLTLAVQHGSASCAEELCKLPAAQQMSSDELAQLLQAAVDSCRGGLAAKQHDGMSAGKLLQSSAGALSRSVFAGPTACKIAVYLSVLPAAVRLSSEAVVAWLQFALHCNDTESTAAYCKLPAAQSLNGVTVAGLLLSAVHAESLGCIAELCCLPGASRMDTEHVAHLLQSSFSGKCAQMLCRLPAAKQLNSEQLIAALAAAVNLDVDKVFPTDSSDIVEELCRLPAAAVVSVECTAQLLLAAAKVCKWKCVEQLLKLPAASHMNRDEAQGATEAAMQGSGSKYECIMLLEAVLRSAGDIGNLNDEME